MRRQLLYAVNILLLAAVYYVTGRLGLKIGEIAGNATPVWPPAGIAIAWLLLGGDRMWPGVLLGAFLVNYETAVPWQAASMIAVGNTCEALLAAYLIKRSDFRPTLDRLWDVLALAFLGGAFSTTVAATIGTTSQALWHQIAWDQYATVWLTWWLGDAAGILLMAPLILVWATHRTLSIRRGAWGMFEAALVMVVLAVTSIFVFGEFGFIDASSRHYPTAYVMFVPLIWMALRFDGRGAVAATLLVATVAVIASIIGVGPFAMAHYPRGASILLTAGFAATVALTSLVIGAATAERRDFAEALTESERRFKSLFDQSADAILLIEGTRITDCNAAAVALTGYRDKQALLAELPANLCNTRQPDGRESNVVAAEAFARAAREGSCRFEWLLRCSDGAERPLEVVITAIPGEQPGGAPLLHVVLRDITTRKQAESQLQEQKAAAEAANQAKDRFLAALSHELRTPLTPVMSNIDLLEAFGTLPPEAGEPLQVMRRNIEVESRLIDDLLDVTRIVRGKLQLTPTQVDAHATIAAAIKSLERDVSVKRLRLTSELRATRSLVRADPDRLEQVFSNLLRNAIKFTPSGGSIVVRTRDAAPGGGDRVIVEVSDTGIGIEPEILPKLFAPFEQGDSSITRQFGGLGLGLSIVSALVAAHGGRLNVHSDGKGCGSTFAVELPTIPAEIETMSAPPAPRHSMSSSPRAPVADGKARILLVEDHADTLRAIRSLLMRIGHEIHTADSVAKAREFAAGLSGDAIDLLICDIGLPDGNGCDVLRDLRARHPNLPAIALSGYGMENDVSQSLSAGFAMHLTKPVEASDLERAIGEMMTSARTG